MSRRKKFNDSFVNRNARLGIGADNLASQGNYEFNLVTKNIFQLEAMYRGSWVVKAVVDAIAEDMTRAGISINSTLSPGYVDKIQASLVKLGIWRQLCSALKWARLYGGSMAVLMLDGDDMSQPLRI